MIKRQETHTPGIKMWVFLMILGIIAIGIGVWTCIGRAQKSSSCTETATATVVDYDVQTELRYRLMTDIYYPIVSYEVNGETMQGESSEGYEETESRPEIGGTLQIRYDPNKPESFLVITGAEDVSPGVFLGLIGVLVFILGVVKTIATSKKNKKAAGRS